MDGRFGDRPGPLLLALFADFNARLDDQSAQMAGLADQIAELRTEVRADVRRLDDRLRAVEIAFGKVDQRLLILERVLIPAPDAGAPDE